MELDLFNLSINQSLSILVFYLGVSVFLVAVVVCIRLIVKLVIYVRESKQVRFLHQRKADMWDLSYDDFAKKYGYKCAVNCDTYKEKLKKGIK